MTNRGVARCWRAFSERYSIAAIGLSGRPAVSTTALWPSSGSPRHCRRGPSASSGNRRSRQTCLPPLFRYQSNRFAVERCNDHPVCRNYESSVSAKPRCPRRADCRFERSTALCEKFNKGMVDGTYNKSLQRTKPPASRSAWPLNSSRYTYRYLLW